MFIPGFNDATHRAVVWICDELPAEAQRQQLVQAPGTCQARAGPPLAAWQPPGLTQPVRGASRWPPHPMGSYGAYTAGGKAAAEPGTMQSRSWAAARAADTPTASLTVPTSSADPLMAESMHDELEGERGLVTLPGLEATSAIQLEGAVTSALDGVTSPAAPGSDDWVLVLDLPEVSLIDESIAN